jgi:CheY-like chemotaxis protein
MASPVPQYSGRTLLLVDDDPVLRTMMARALADEGYAVLAAANGSEALALASTLGSQLGLVITDIRMPGMNGLELAEYLARLKPPAPVLFLSGFADPAPAGAFLAKPFVPEALIEQVGQMLRDPAHRP